MVIGILPSQETNTSTRTLPKSRYGSLSFLTVFNWLLI